MEAIVNRVANSKLITLDLDEYLPKEELIAIDIAEGLYEGLILKELDFRAWVKELSKKHQDKVIFVPENTEAIIPKWAFLLLSTSLSENNNKVYFGTKQSALEELILDQVAISFASQLADQSMVIIKGCSKQELSGSLYGKLATLLKPKCKTLMFGEPCSTVPIYKAQKKP